MKLNDFINKLIELRDEGCDYIGIENLDGEISNKININIEDAHVITEMYIHEDEYENTRKLRNGNFERVSRVIISNGDGLCDYDDE